MTTHYLRFLGYFSPGAIDVSKTAQIPGDYYGCMGVPITALDKIGSGPENPWEIMDMIDPVLHGKALYKRIIIRKKLPPEVEEYIDKGGVVLKHGDDLLVPLNGTE